MVFSRIKSFFGARPAVSPGIWAKNEPDAEHFATIKPAATAEPARTLKRATNTTASNSKCAATQEPTATTSAAASTISPSVKFPSELRTAKHSSQSPPSTSYNATFTQSFASISSSTSSCHLPGNRDSQAPETRNHEPEHFWEVPHPTRHDSRQRPEVEIKEARSSTNANTNGCEGPHPTPPNSYRVPSSPQKTTSRPKLQPVRQEDRRATMNRHPENEPDDEPELEYEFATLDNFGIEFEDPPQNDMPDSPCGSNGHHELACGHWISDSSITQPEKMKPEPCGLNCLKPSHHILPFDCPQCRKTVDDILRNDLTDTEQEKLRFCLQTRQEALGVSYMVEFVAKRGKLTANITETVASIGSGRTRKSTEAAPPEPLRYFTPQEIIDGVNKERRRQARKVYDEKKKKREEDKRREEDKKRGEEKKRDEEKTKHDAETKHDAKVYGTKRKVSTSDDSSHRKRVTVAPPVQFGVPAFHCPPTSQTNVETAAEEKTKTENKRGDRSNTKSKRSAHTNTRNAKSAPPNITKARTYTTIQTDRRKRKDAPTFDEMFNPKRIVAPPVQFGKTSSPRPPPGVVGSIFRKRGIELVVDTWGFIGHRKKRGEMRK